MSHLTSSLECTHSLTLHLRRAGLLLFTLLLVTMTLWLFFRTLSPVGAAGSPLNHSLPISSASMPLKTEPLAPLAMAGDSPLTLAWSTFKGEDAFSVAWGDADGDGDLDLAVGGRGESVQVYQNQGTAGGILQLTLVYTAPVVDATRSVAWGDYDNDGDLDLAVGNSPESGGADQYNRIYRNDGIVAGIVQMTLAWTASITGTTHSVAWGDYDGDGDLDLAVGNAGRYNNGCSCFLGDYNRLYHNDGVVAGLPQMTLVWAAPMTDTTRSVAWGDWNGDGDLDLAVGNAERPNRVYRNVGGATPLELWWTAQVTDTTQSVAWGDYDGDGDLDLAVGNGHWTSAIGEPNRIYRNTGTTLTVNPVYTTTESEPTHSIAWGDYDGDGDLDLAVGNARGPNQLYRNDSVDETPIFTLIWSAFLVEGTQSVAWGDVDGDGDLDLVVGNSSDPIRLYRNEGTALTSDLAWTSDESDSTWNMAWGDYDKDGDLDLAVGNYGQPNRVYRNAGGMLATSAAWTAPFTENTTSIAWGDYDKDGDLDLAVGNAGQPNRLYRNIGGSKPFTLTSWLTTAQNTRAIAWGDYDNDGNLDLAVGNYGQPNCVYRNTGGMLATSAAWTAPISRNTTSLAWGDVDNDGDLDLAVGNNGGPIRLYRNDSGSLTPSVAWSSDLIESTSSVAWGDVDGDGDLDLAAGNDSEVNRLYRNNGGTLTSLPVWSSIEADSTLNVVWGDYDGDGDLDLAVGNGFSGHPSRVYRNDDGALTASAVWSSPSVPGPDYPRSVAWGDVDRDGDLDLAVGHGYYSTGHPNRLYLNSRDARSSPASIPVVSVRRPSPPSNADGYSSAVIWSGGVVSIPYTLKHPQGAPVRFIRAFYSPDGGGQWLPAQAASGTITQNLATTATYTYRWDVLSSGFFGQSDNVVFRIQSVPAITHTPNSIPGPYLYGAYASQTFPFRVRGTQVRVLSNTVPVSNAIVYRLPAGQTTGAIPFADATGRPFRTDSQGYLQGRGEINIGDELVALLPISSTDTYTPYHTSAAPTLSGLDAYTVTGKGVQTLVVSSANPLILFNLDVSLEWDARQDTAYLNQLEFNLQRASEVLYDITNGQAALGNVNVFHDRGQWNYAHVRIYADNQLRPYASQGGVTTVPISDPVTTTVIYLPGQVSMGATWNRYGNAGIALGEDWPRTLAHELGHYLLYQDDDYLGLNASGLLVPVSTCINTIMADAYRDDYSELRPPANWLPDCANTLSNRSTGRSDWTTVDTFYPALHITDNAGPIGLPLAVTQVRFVGPVTPTMTLPDPRFYLTQNGARVQPGSHAQGYLFRGDQLVSLGRPVVDQLLARGAQPDDRVCVFEPEANRLGCKVVAPDDNQQLALYTVSGWQPDVRITPVSSQTVNVQVLNLSPGLDLQARLYASTGLASPPQALTWIVGSIYSTTFNLGDAVFEGSVDVWVDEADPRREVVAHYALGGDPANARGGFANARGGFANARGGFANARGGFAPVLSGDGQVILYSANLDFPPGEFYTLQAATLIPDPPTWATVVGKGYRLLRSAGAPNLVGPSISMGYAQNEVPSGEETFLRVFVMTGTTWVALPTTLDVDNNLAVSPAQGPGLYVLMSTIEIPLYGPGWDAFSYPVQATQTVEQALQSIAGKYSMVYWYDGSDGDDPWKVYAINLEAWARPWVNDLNDLRFGESYWISLTQVITLQLNGGAASAQAADGNVQSPPATFYGLVLGGFNFMPAPGMTVTAWVNGVPCGQGKTLQLNGEIAYTLNVFADGPGGAAGCGAPGRVVTFKVGDKSMSPVVAWDNNQLWEVPLSVAHRVYLPVVVKNR